ncbi:helix-turn-helix domain-containing protein [Thermogemmatispora sp.]|uniref:helix-turn-helix domain-containing protein n=1 Tax=Thermogemmatispora sp. TaxID=1968838 RepID=UPI0035E4341A
MFRLRVKEIAEAKGMTPSALSKAASLSDRTVRRIFQNPYAQVNLRTLMKIATALEVQAPMLIEFLPEEEPPPGTPPRRARPPRRYQPRSRFSFPRS